MWRLTLFHRAVVAACLGLAVLVCAVEPTIEVTGETVELPPFVVTQIVIGPHWRYVSIPGYEIISQCSDRETREIVAALWRGPQLSLPSEFRPNFSLPMTVVLFDQAPGRPGNVQSFGSERRPSEFNRHWTNVIKRTLQDRESFSLNLWLSSFDYSSTFRFDTNTLLRRRAPTAPAWLNEGLFGGYGVYREGVYWHPGDTYKQVQVGAWWSKDESVEARGLAEAARRHFEKAKRPFKPSPLAALVPELSTILEAPSPRPDDPAVGRWASAAALFVRWGIYGRTPEAAEQFWRFAERACAEPVTEKIFQECFGRTYAEVRAEFSWYLPIALSSQAAAPVNLIPPPKFEFRDATNAEIDRLLGEWQRMEAVALAPRFPELAKSYREQAALNLERRYNRGGRDPRLLASLGLLALDTGQFTRAHELLEAAVAGKVAGPRVYLEAARLRWAGNLTDGKGTLSPEALVGVINLLLMAEQQGPPMVSVYSLLAEAVTRAGMITSEQAAALRRGVGFFPRNPGLQQRINAVLALSL